MKGGDMAKAKKCVPILVIFLMAFRVCMAETAAKRLRSSYHYLKFYVM
jgi:hypothetical protein